MVSDNCGNKRPFSYMESNTGEKMIIPSENLNSMSPEERRDYVRTNKVPSNPQDFKLVSSKWYEDFMKGEDHPVVLGKGAAAEKVNSDVYNTLISWYGIDEHVFAFRLASLRKMNTPFTIVDLKLDATVESELHLEGARSQIWVAEVYSQFIPEYGVSEKVRYVISSSTCIRDIDLFENESLIISTISTTPLGHVGLNNMGNTCFMNSSLQALLHIPELIHYFVSDEYKRDLNPYNPIGCGGEVAKAFANLVREMYIEDQTYPSIRPTEFLKTIGRFNRSFASRSQQDSQEFTTFLLDSLHEDLNRIINKPNTEKPELADDMAVTNELINKLATESWKIHKKRNDSKIMDLFTGVYKSTLVCPNCEKISITFDPFFDITLPLPGIDVWTRRVTFVPRNSPITFIDVALQPNSIVIHLLEQIAKTMNIPESSKLILGDVYTSRFYRLLKDTDVLGDTIDSGDEIFIYEVNATDGANVPVYLRYGNVGCGIPFFINMNDSYSYDSVKTQILDRLMQFKSLYTSNNEAVVSGLSINIFKGTIDELVYGNGGSRLQEWPGISSDVDASLVGSEEPFVNIHPEEPKHEVAENLPTPESSPNAAPYSPSSSSSSISPLSSTASLPEVPKVLDNNAKIDPNNLVLVVDLNSAYIANNIDSIPVIETPAASKVKEDLKEHKNVTLDECLRNFSQPEVLSDEDLWYCPRCKDFRKAQKQLELWDVPNVMMVHLKRFSGMHNISRKLNDLVEFPLEGLDLSSYVSPAVLIEGVTKEEFVYDLIAVDNHYGGMGGGHYTSYVKDSFTNEWLDFNDSFVTHMDRGNVCTEAAYLLFYRKRTTNNTQMVDETSQAVNMLRHRKFHSFQTAKNVPEKPSQLDDETNKDENTTFPGEGRVLGSSNNPYASQVLPWADS